MFIAGGACDDVYYVTSVKRECAECRKCCCAVGVRYEFSIFVMCTVLYLNRGSIVCIFGFYQKVMETLIFSIGGNCMVVMESRMYCLGVGEVLFNEVMESGCCMGECRYKWYQYGFNFRVIGRMIGCGLGERVRVMVRVRAWVRVRV